MATVQTKKVPVTENWIYQAMTLRTQKGLPDPAEHLEVIGWHYVENTWIYAYGDFRLWYRSVVSRNWLAFWPEGNVKLVFERDEPVLRMIEAMNRELSR